MSPFRCFHLHAWNSGGSDSHDASGASDASIGGKTGVICLQEKFGRDIASPKLVLIDPQVLSTLTEREFRAGIFEVIKCGIIRDPKLFKVMEDCKESILKRDENALLQIIMQR